MLSSFDPNIARTSRLETGLTPGYTQWSHYEWETNKLLMNELDFLAKH